MSYSAPPGWYSDPAGSGGQRYFDGASWTDYTAPRPQPHAPPYAYPAAQLYSQPYAWARPWKGARIGRPAEGPGSLANPGRRLGARALDGLVLLPVFAGLAVLAVLLVAPHAGPMFPPDRPDGTTPTPGFVWVYLAVIGAFFASGLIMVGYETVATARYGRTLGKAWLHIRPVRTDGRPLGYARSFGRIALYWASGFLNWLGILDPLWCLWDENHQCLHDKAVDSIVINDLTDGPQPVGHPGGAPVTAQRPAPPAGQGWSSRSSWAGPPSSWAGPPSSAGSAGWNPSWPWGPFAPPVKTNGLSIASLTCSIGGFLLLGVPSILGIVFGFVAQSQIRKARGAETGGGLALAGIIVGFVVVAFYLAIFIGAAVSGSSGN